MPIESWTHYLIYLSIEKSFHDFRQLVAAFKKAAKDASDKARRKDNRGWKGVPESTQNLIAFTECFAHVIEAEPISTFVGKVSMMHLLLYFEQ